MIARMRLLLSLTAWCAAGGAIQAQQPATARKVYTNRPLFSVPLKIEEADRVKITSLKCYVKPPGGAWMVHDSGTAQTARFTYQASVDGEYLFSFATIDSAGRESPSNIEREAPRLIVIVDTKQPEFMVAPVSVASGASYVQCTMKDANPEMASITAEAELADGTFQSMLPVDSNVPGFFRTPATGMPNRVRISGKDKAGNAVVTVSAVDSTKQTPPVVVAVTPKQEPVAVLPIPAKAETAKVTPNVPKLEPISAPASKSTGSGLLLPDMATKVNPVSNASDALPKPVAVLPRVAEKPAAVETPPVVPATAEQFANSLRCVLNYAVDGIDLKLVQKVEAYYTKDDSKTWEKLGEDPDRISPIELQLPADGRYGIVIVISAVNRPGQAPAVGEQPDWVIEADSIAPEVTLESATPGVGDDAGMLILKWHVSDKNLKTDAVEFSWSNGPEGPWQSIAKGLRAEGLYRWPVPREAGSKAFLKIEAQDKAGNIGRAATGQAVPVEVNRPRAKVLGINPAAMKQ